MKFTNKQKGDIGEPLVSMTLMNMGLDVININTIYRNYKNASKQNAKKQHPEYISTLSQTSKDKWYKITKLLD